MHAKVNAAECTEAVCVSECQVSLTVLRLLLCFGLVHELQLVAAFNTCQLLQTRFDVHNS